MDRILFATDLSGRSDRALDRALLLTASSGAKLAVVHIIQKDPYLPKSDVERELEEAIGRLGKTLEDTVGDVGAVPEHKVAVGDPAEEILKFSQGFNADLIVVGLSKVFSFESLFRGTTVDKVIAKSTVPVLIVKSRPKREYRHALVALDQSFSSRSALIAALKLAPDARFTIVHAVDSIKPDSAELEHIKDEIVGVCQRCFKEALARDGEKCEFEVHIRVGSGGDVVCNHVDNVKPDLVSFGRSNKTGLRALVIGSTARILIEHLQCDMLVAPAR